MTTINCTSNCMHQNNGKCGLQNVQSVTRSSDNGDCAYFAEIKEDDEDEHFI